MAQNQQPLIINGWAEGMSDSPHRGIPLIRNADIDSFPGALKVAKKPATLFHSITTRTFTADAATDICTASGTIEANGASYNGAAVYFTTTGTLPAGLSTGTVYYLYAVTSTTFQVCTSYKNSVGSAAGTVINITSAGSGTHTMTQLGIGTINWIIKDPRTSYYWMLSSNGRVWFIPSGTMAYLLHNSAIENVTGSLTNASGNGIVLNPFSSTTATYLFVFRNGVIDVINVFGDTQIEALSWSNAWQSLNTAAGTNNSHHAIKAQDDAVYFCDARYVGSILEVAGSTFDPANGATYTYNNQALDLPQYEIAQCLEELGTNLLAGGNIFNKIYPWDRISDSFNYPILVPEFSIKRMKNVGGLVFVLAGTWGNIYTTQGTYAKFFKKVPFYATNNSYTITSTTITWGGLEVMNGGVVFGLAGQSTGSSGVYRLFSDGRLVHDNTPSTGSANVVGLYAENEFYLMGYSGGADYFTSNQYSSFNAVAHSQLYKIGTKTNKATYSLLEAQIATPATSGNVRIGYRTDKSSSFTTLDTYAADSSSTSFKTDIGLTDLENIQMQVEADGNVEVLEVRLFP